MLSGPLAGAWNVVKEIPSVLVTILVTIISCVFMTAEYDIIRDMILSFFTEEKGKKIVEAKRVVSKGVGKLLKAYLTIMLITFTEVFLGLNLMKLIGIYEGGYIAIIAFVVCIVDIVPVLGTGTVVIPWAIYSFVTGNVGLGIGLAILYVVITILRQAIEPKLVANQVGLPSIVTIIAMFLGGRLFGVFGVVLLPLTVIVLKLMLDEGIIGKKSREPQIVEAAATENSEESESIPDNEAE
jgi:sporulation integral membrane protein YtvI